MWTLGISALGASLLRIVRGLVVGTALTLALFRCSSLWNSHIFNTYLILTLPTLSFGEGRIRPIGTE